MMQTGDDLREWRESALYWEKHSPVMRTMFAPLTRALIEEAGIVRGQRVLDVAGGAGEPSLTIAEAVGPQGSITCTDAVAEMVSAAQREAQRRRLTNIIFRQCPAESLPFSSDSFDAVVSRLGVMFSPDPLAALREMLRVTRPGGTISLAVWGRNDLNPYSHIPTSVLARYITAASAAPDAPGPFCFAEPGALARLLLEAGSTDVRERLLEFRLEAPISAADFWAMRAEISSTLREGLMMLSAEERGRVAREAEEAVGEFFPHGRMNFPAQAVIVSGGKRV